MRAHSERGIALILALLLTSVMSVLAVSMMFLSQTETYATMNYRMMSQARFAGEAAIQRAGNFLMDPVQFGGPGSAGDPLSAYNTNVSPVTRVSNGLPVVLSASPLKASNYPVGTAVTAFQAAATGDLAAGNTNLEYSAYAELISIQVFKAYGSSVDTFAATWKVTGIGGIENSPNSAVEVTTLIERPKVSANAYAAFATGNTCGAMYFHGNVTINSYDSANTPAGSVPTMQSTGGNVGTNGNLHIQGSVEVQGNLSTPRTGVGDCTAGSVTALTETGSADVEGSVVQLPAEVSFPVPTFTAPTNNVTIDAALLGDPTAACAALGTYGGTPLTLGTNCFVSGSTVTIDANAVHPVTGVVNGAEITMPSISVASGYTLKFRGRTGPSAEINLNSLSGAGSIEVEANMGATHANEAVVLKVAGKNSDGTDMATPFDLETMGWKQNSTQHSYDASALQIIYGGPGTIRMDGNINSAATIYAPNANFILMGTTDLFGSVLAKTVTNGGNAGIHFDRRLTRDFFVAGRPMASNFSWKRY